LRRISAGAFAGNTNLEYVEIASCDSLLSIGQEIEGTTVNDGAFANCTNLNITNLPNSIEIIYPYSFYQCEKITFDALPINLIQIGNAAF